MANAIQNKKYIFSLFLVLLFSSLVLAQKKTSKKEMIKLVNADKIERVPEKYNGNLLFSGNVVFEHKGAILRADSAVFYQQENYFEAFSNVQINNQKYNITAGYVQYNGNTETAVAEKYVVLRDDKQTLYTDRLDYDRKSNKAYYTTGGTIVSKDSKITSQSGEYDISTKTNTFDGNVIIDNADYYIDGDNVKYNSGEGLVQFLGKTTIQNKKNRGQYIKTTRGSYHLNKKEAFLKDRSTVYSDKKSITADDLYYNQLTGQGEGAGDVFLDDPEERRFIKGEIAKFYKELDSAFVTQNALAVRAFENDSLYLHADTLLATKRDSMGLVRAFHNAKFFKSNAQGKSDSIVYSEKTSSIGLFKEPILWSDAKQITGDTILVYINTKYEQLDSIQVRNNAFAMAQRDSINPKDFNQIRSKNMTAMFKNDSIEWVQAFGNAQSTLFLEDENKKTKQKELLGINRSDCGIIEATFEEQKMEIISCKIGQQSKLYPPTDFPEDQQYLPGFLWRGKERFKRWQDIMNDSPTPPEQEPEKNQEPKVILKKEE
uniref:OstA-like protein n=1 Tax=Ornithobacterium rhinotracheale TaxID=28251 RepID=UPI0039A4153C